MWIYIYMWIYADNPQFIVNGFIRSGVMTALDGREAEEHSDSHYDGSNNYGDEDSRDEDENSSDDTEDSNDAGSSLEDFDLEDLGCA